MILAPTDKSKYTMKKYEELLSKIRHLIRSITNSSKSYDEKLWRFTSERNAKSF